MLFICHKKALEQEKKTKKKKDQAVGKQQLDIKVPIIWIVGGTRSGKSTQCQKIVNKYNFTYLNVADILQKEIQSGSDGSKLISKTIIDGGHIPDFLVLGLLFNSIVENIQQSAGFIIDGFPRNVTQATEFEGKIGQIDCLIYLVCSTETMIKRNDGNDNLVTPEILYKKNKFFKERMTPIVSKLSMKLQEINGEKSIDDVFGVIDKIIKDILMNKYNIIK